MENDNFAASQAPHDNSVADEESVHPFLSSISIIFIFALILTLNRQFINNDFQSKHKNVHSKYHQSFLSIHRIDNSKAIKRQASLIVRLKHEIHGNCCGHRQADHWE